MKTLIHPNDPYKMNWVEGNKEWGTVKCPEGIEATAVSKQEGNIVFESYTFTNVTERDIFTSLQDIAIYTTFNDDYKDSETCVTKRCHTHIWCGEDITYVMALRMGGEAPHLGMVLTKGSIGGYSVERDFKKMSNDRGDFLMHPSPVSLSPGESFTIEWTLFWHEGKEDFYKKLPEYCEKYIEVKAENYVVFEGEKININITPTYNFSADEVGITCNGRNVDFELSDGAVKICDDINGYGEYQYLIDISGVKTKCGILVQPKLDELAKRRCYFIADNQQYHKEGSHMDGALLIYDNEEKHMVYKHKYDYNSARERIGMGLLLIKYLQKSRDEYLEKCLKKYIRFVNRELFDEESGMVFNDYMRDNTYFRLYNYPWVSLFFAELYELYDDKKYLENAYKALKSFYDQGGAKFYAIEVPLQRMVRCLDKEGMDTEKEEILSCFREHCDFIIKQGRIYPSHEVNYEQSISAPATEILIQMYMVTKEQKYMDGAKQQMGLLEQFNGLQPDYHMYEVALRHWDGYWFGKRALYGDTYPHYWSSLTGNSYSDFGEITQNPDYERKAEASLRGSLSLFKADGSASCAFVYPVSVNGQSANYYDPYANDQDWGLYFMLRHVMEKA